MKIELSYQTQELPPPYAFAASFEIALDLDRENVEIAFQLVYLDREDLSEEELSDQGFTGDDDFSWQGYLGKKWIPILSSLKSLEYLTEPREDSYLHVVIDGVEKGFPAVAQEEVIQELIQGVFESAKRETPLKIQIADKHLNLTALTWEFGPRRFLIGQQEHNWEKSRSLMQLCYSLEFDEDSVFDKPVPDSINFQETLEWLKIDTSQTKVEIRKMIDQITKS